MIFMICLMILILTDRLCVTGPETGFFALMGVLELAGELCILAFKIL